MIFVNILGGNATGKSTRVGCFVRYLSKRFGKYEPVIYYSMKAKKEKEVGRLYETSIGKIFILGRFNQKDAWVSLDTADFSTYDSRYEFINYMSDKADLFIQEGYFNNMGKAFTYEIIKEKAPNVEKVIHYYFLYDKPEQFLERVTLRTGKQRDLEWAKNAPGWKNNLAQTRNYNELLEMKEKGETQTIIKKVDINEPKDFFIREFFDDYDGNFKCETKTKKAIEW